MSTLLVSPRHASIDGWLHQSALNLRQHDAGRWQLSLENGTRLPVSISADDDFVFFDAPVELSCALEESPRWLQRNAELAGGAKIAIAARPWRPRLRAELPIDEDAGMPARITQTLCGLQDACVLLDGVTPAEQHHDATCEADESTIATKASPGLADLLSDSGWSFQEHSGLAAVEITVRGESCRISLEENTTGLRARTEFLCADSPASDSRLAIAVLLLCAGGALRLARPFATNKENQYACGFEVRLAKDATAVELDHALQALAVACWACKKEALCLLDNAIARSYLAIRNPPTLFAREEF